MSETAKNRLLFAVALLLAALYLFPLYWMYVTSLKTGSSIFAVPPEFLPGEPQWQTYAEVWATKDIPRYLWNSVLIASGVTLVTAAVGSGAGYVLARYRSIWIDAALFLILMLQVLPPSLMVTPIFVAFSSIGLLDTTRIGSTSVYVTHDQIEAMTMADHMVVLRAGVVKQQGAPLELYGRPANKFVAGFIGSPSMNFVAGVVAEDGKSVTLELRDTPTIVVGRALEPGRAVIAGLRPKHIEVTEPRATVAAAMRISAAEATGSASYLFSDDDRELIVVTDGTSDLKKGDEIGFRIAPERVHLFDPETEESLSLAR